MHQEYETERCATYLKIWPVLNIVRVEESNTSVHHKRFLVKSAEQWPMKVDDLNRKVRHLSRIGYAEWDPGLRRYRDVVAMGGCNQYECIS